MLKMTQMLSDNSRGYIKLICLAEIESFCRAEQNSFCVQLTSPVLWENSMNTLLAKGLERSYEIGPNKVIAGIFKRIDKKHSITNITV